MERERMVETSTGPVLVRRISWKGWRLVKSQALRFLEGRVAARVKSIPPPGAVEPQRLGWEILPELARELAEEMDVWVFEFLKACGVDAAVLDNIDAIDAVLLRDAAYEVSDFSTLLEHEKNLLAQLAAKACAAVGITLPQLPSLSPTPGGNPS
jgi:hypothetical protein